MHAHTEAMRHPEGAAATQSRAMLPLTPLPAQFDTHAAPRAMLLASAGDQVMHTLAAQAMLPADVVEAAPHDFFWGRGVDGSGSNHLGALLVRLRTMLLSQPATVPVQDVARPGRPVLYDDMPAGC